MWPSSPSGGPGPGGPGQGPGPGGHSAHSSPFTLAVPISPTTPLRRCAMKATAIRASPTDEPVGQKRRKPIFGRSAMTSSALLGLSSVFSARFCRAARIALSLRRGTGKPRDRESWTTRQGRDNVAARSQGEGGGGGCRGRRPCRELGEETHTHTHSRTHTHTHTLSVPSLSRRYVAMPNYPHHGAGGLSATYRKWRQMQVPVHTERAGRRWRIAPSPWTPTLLRLSR